MKKHRVYIIKYLIHNILYHSGGLALICCSRRRGDKNGRFLKRLGWLDRAEPEGEGR